MGGYGQQSGSEPSKLALALIALEKGHYPFKNYRHAHAKRVFFPGCNFPSLYPKTCAELTRLLSERCAMGVAFDCCGKPLAEMGREEQFEGIVRRIGEHLSARGVEEIVCACPNCFYTLRGRIPQRVTSVYAVLRDLGMGECRAESGAAGSASDVAPPLLFPSCPDRREGLLLDDVLALVGGQATLPRCAGIENARSQGARPACARKGACKGCELLPCCRQDCGAVIASDQQVLTYCASCVGYLRGAGHANVQHVLTRVLGTNEQPDLARSFINRARTKLA